MTREEFAELIQGLSDEQLEMVREVLNHILRERKKEEKGNDQGRI